MSGLIRGKRLVWVRDVHYINCWRAECQFGLYCVWRNGQEYRWRLLSDDDRRTIHEGKGGAVEQAQAACQSDHDLRAMASVEVVPFEWSQGDYPIASAGPFTLTVIEAADADWLWVWSVKLGFYVYEFGIVDSREKAIQFAETFVRQLVMGVR